MNKFYNFLLIIFLGFSIPLYSKETKKVALLFLTIRDLNQTELWKELLFRDLKYFNVYMHPKERITDVFFSDFTINNRVATTWMKHMRAWRALLHKALLDQENYKFILLSDSHIPLRPLNEIYKQVMKDNLSYIGYGKPWWPKDCSREVVLLPPEHRWVNSEWVVLNRHHALMMCQDELIINIVEKFHHSCEAYCSCLFSYYNCLKNGEVLNKETTYVDFLSGKDSHPYVFETDTEENIKKLRNARNEGYLFARKISPGFPPKALKKIIFRK